jgi:hypothetical protein
MLATDRRGTNQPQTDAAPYSTRLRHFVGPVEPMRPQRPSPGLADDRARYSPETNDSLIRRDYTPWYPRATVVPAGTGRASWWAAGPARPELAQRNVTVNPRQGNSRSRAMQNPLAPGTGLHTEPQHAAIGTIARYVNPDNPRMSTARQNRLLPARYTGQSYSQTTLTQGARR